MLLDPVRICLNGMMIHASAEFLAKPIDDRTGKRFLALKVVVEGRFGDARLLQNPVQADGVDAVPMK